MNWKRILIWVFFWPILVPFVIGLMISEEVLGIIYGDDR